MLVLYLVHFVRVRQQYSLFIKKFHPFLDIFQKKRKFQEKSHALKPCLTTTKQSSTP